MGINEQWQYQQQGRKIKIIKYQRQKIWQHGSDSSDGSDSFNAAMEARVPTKQQQHGQGGKVATAAVTAVTAGLAVTAATSAIANTICLLLFFQLYLKQYYCI
jgi:hypothetical protein